MHNLSHKGKMLIYLLLIGLIVLCSALLVLGFDFLLLSLVLKIISSFRNIPTTGDSNPYIVAYLYIVLYAIPALILNYIFINYWAKDKLPSFTANLIPKYHSELLGKTLDIFTLLITLILFLYKNSDVIVMPNTFDTILLSIYPFNLSHKIYSYLSTLNEHVDSISSITAMSPKSNKR